MYGIGIGTSMFGQYMFDVWGGGHVTRYLLDVSRGGCG